MNKAIRRMAVAAIILMLALMANSTYIQAFRAEELNAKNGNRRVTDSQFSVNRGPITVGNGNTAIAASVPSDDRFEYLRTYPGAGNYAHLTGYYSFVFGRSGIEQSQNAALNGTDPSLVFRRVLDVVTKKRQQGASVKLTIDPRAQAAAIKGLKGKKGAVVAIDPKTGKILASVSMPSYDPNLLAGHDIDKVQAAWNRLNADKDKPMLNRAERELYPPGSTFKLVTAAAALSSGKYTPESQVDSPAVLNLPQSTATLPNQNGRNCGGSNRATILVALRESCNTAFGVLGMELGPEALREQAEKFGFGERHLPEIGAVASRFPEDPNAPQVAQSAIGQFDVRSTPLQMAMVVAGIANKGEVMKPYLVSEITTPDLKTISETKPESLHQAVSPEVAEQLNRMMVDVVKNGTGKPAQIDGIEVAGKTGTAQTSKDRPPYAWFVSYAPANDPQVAVAVVVEDAGVARDDISGGRLAAPIAKDVMEAVLNR
ncbi:peptidoglycan D,D-transpeptidase FtsI family protein [Kribbella deserti]|uniref:Peptidoglycan D,D-transpeptidase FtsI family protein n=1 Tax=Kribbella deserti TaxID=1926257 RepID=A0ABV6QWJ6_9ACTN